MQMVFKVVRTDAGCVSGTSENEDRVSRISERGGDTLRRTRSDKGLQELDDDMSRLTIEAF